MKRFFEEVAPSRIRAFLAEFSPAQTFVAGLLLGAGGGAFFVVVYTAVAGPR